MQLRLPEVYCDAKQFIEDSLVEKKLILSKFNSTMANMCDVTHFHIVESEDKEAIGSLELTISYKEHVITKYEKFDTIRKTQDLLILNTKGDPIWPYIMVTKVWNGDYPSGVALNLKTGMIYLMYLGVDNLKLTEFSLLNDSQLECIRESLNETSPYKIKLAEQAMFDVLSELEGTRYLHNNVYIELNCGVKIQVYASENIVNS